MGVYFSVALKVIDVLIFLVLMRGFITFFHEMGHATAYLFLTKNIVSVFLGTYGSREKSLRVLSGRLEIWIIRNPLKWKGGLCESYSSSLSTRGHLIGILAGPFASLLLALITYSIYLFAHPSGLWEPLMLIFAIASGLSFLYNISPAYAGIMTGKGDIIYNDGYQAKAILDHKKLPADYHEAMIYFQQRNYPETARLLEPLIHKGHKNADVYRTAIAAHMEMRNYARADELQKKQINRIGNLNAHDRVTLALLKTFLGKHEEAVKYCKHLLQVYGDNKYNFNILGYTLNLMERYHEAIPCLDKAILLDSEYSDPYSNRGYAKIKTGMKEEGRKDIEQAILLDDSNGDAHRNMGIYLFEVQMYNEALVEFEKAKNLDPSIPLLDRYIFDTHDMLARSEK